MKLPLIIIAVLAVIVAVVVLLMYRAFTIVKTETNGIKLASLDDIPKGYWAKLAEKKIFFGHKSVGYNIIDGIKDIIKEHDYISLNIVETTDPADFNQSIFAHAQVGNNTDPISKISEFKNFIEVTMGNKIDIALFKFCYVDVNHDSDIHNIFDKYTGVMNELADQYPHTEFMHLTVPICAVSGGTKKTAKFFVKSLIGRPGVLDDNMKREHYNALLNKTYADRGNVFDLALIESVNPDGFRCSMKKNGDKVFVMAPEYTSDGGHLNIVGRKIIAEQFLISLARVANKQ